MARRIDRIVKTVIGAAEEAAAAGTFGVGGALIDGRGRVLLTMQNKVIENNRVMDPTAHVERQTVDAYFDKLREGHKLPPPSELTIVSSLDPCMMCGGSILATGFNVVSMGRDDFAGINHDMSGRFSTLSDKFARAARKTFGYFGVDGERPQGPIPSALAPGGISAEAAARAARAFSDSMDGIRSRLNTDTEQPQNPALYFSSGKNRGLLERIRLRSPHFLRGEPGGADALPSSLANVLSIEAHAAKDRGGNLNAALLVDPFGNILMARGGDEHLSPIRTPFMQLTRAYARLRNELGAEGDALLPHPKHCRVVLLKGPGRTAADIADMGAFGSTMEGPMPGDFPHLQYIMPSQPQASLDKMMDRFPPLYRDVIKVRPVRVQGL